MRPSGASQHSDVRCWVWLDHRTRAQQQRFMLWLKTLKESGAKFVVNPSEATVPNQSIGLGLGALDGVQRLYAAL